jgi:hypothetical protein
MPTAIQRVQQRLGVHSSGQWDAVTDGALLAFQSAGHGQYPMDAHGHPDAATLANLGYYATGDIFPQPWVDYLGGGAKPGTFVRDIETAIDQVPRWAWATVAVSFGLFAYMSWRGDKKRARGGG